MDVRGWVYVISNPAMPGLVKVGFSLKDPTLRALELDGTGIPHPFRVEYEALVPNPRIVEQRAHIVMKPLHERKEWFRCSVPVAVEALREIIGESILLEADFDKSSKTTELAYEALERRFDDEMSGDDWVGTEINDDLYMDMKSLIIASYLEEKETRTPLDELIIYDIHFLPWNRERLCYEHVREWSIDKAYNKICAWISVHRNNKKRSDKEDKELRKLYRLKCQVEEMFFEGITGNPDHQ
jgi:hypothetical protein